MSSNCVSCEAPFNDGDKVVVTVSAQIVNGKIEQSEPEEVRHEECPGERWDEDDN